MPDEDMDKGLTNDEFEVAFAAAAGGDVAEETTDDSITTTASAEDTGTAKSGENETVVEGVAGDETTEAATAAEGVPSDDKTESVIQAEPPKVKERKVEPAIDPAIEIAAKKEREKIEADALASAAAREQPTAEEAEHLKSVLEVFPDVAKALATQERILTAKFENQVAKTIKEIEARFEQRIVPAEHIVQQVARSNHEAEILKIHPDAFTVLPKVEDWVNALPQFLQNTYNAVLDRGSSADIVALYDIFKKETGSAHSHTPTPEEIAQQKADAHKAEAQKAEKDKKLKSMEQVKGRQSAQKSGIDEDDFESAFNAAANS